MTNWVKVTLSAKGHNDIVRVIPVSELAANLHTATRLFWTITSVEWCKEDGTIV